MKNFFKDDVSEENLQAFLLISLSITKYDDSEKNEELKKAAAKVLKDPKNTHMRTTVENVNMTWWTQMENKLKETLYGTEELTKKRKLCHEKNSPGKKFITPVTETSSNESVTTTRRK